MILLGTYLDCERKKQGAAGSEKTQYINIKQKISQQPSFIRIQGKSHLNQRWIKGYKGSLNNKRQL
jgi:hypothetical protein